MVDCILSQVEPSRAMAEYSRVKWGQVDPSRAMVYIEGSRAKYRAMVEYNIESSRVQ